MMEDIRKAFPRFWVRISLKAMQRMGLPKGLVEFLGGCDGGLRHFFGVKGAIAEDDIQFEDLTGQDDPPEDPPDDDAETAFEDEEELPHGEHEHDFGHLVPEEDNIEGDVEMDEAEQDAADGVDLVAENSSKSTLGENATVAQLQNELQKHPQGARADEN